jgi:transposase
MRYASDTRGTEPFYPLLGLETSDCPQLPTTLPTFDELLGREGIDEMSIAEAVFQRSGGAARPGLQVFTLHAELEGLLLLDAFEALLIRWKGVGAELVRMDNIHEQAMRQALPCRAVVMQSIPGRSGVLATQAVLAGAPA